MAWLSGAEVRMYSDVECPYCGAGQEINHDDGYGYEEDRAHEQECGDCEKTFVYTTSISFSYEAKKADCLNGEHHRFRPTCTIPKIYTQMECKDCDERRPLTELEWFDFLEPMQSA